MKRSYTFFWLISLFVQLPFVLAHGDEEDMMHHMWGIDFGWGGMLLMYILMIAFWILIIYLIYEALRIFSKENKKEEKDPLAIAKERLAKGEITTKEFKIIKKEISS